MVVRSCTVDNEKRADCRAKAGTDNSNVQHKIVANFDIDKKAPNEEERYDYDEQQHYDFDYDDFDDCNDDDDVYERHYCDSCCKRCKTQGPKACRRVDDDDNK